jgi:hypothetical protein
MPWWTTPGAEVRARTHSGKRSDDETAACTFNARVLSGRLRSAVRTLTNRDSGGGILHPDDACTKYGILVLEVLQSKHPDLREPPAVGGETGTFEDYAAVPTAIPVDLTKETVEVDATRLSGTAGPRGMDAVSLRNWLLQFGKESEARHCVMKWLDGPPGWPMATHLGQPIGR